MDYPCWFCRKFDGEMVWSMEWDTPVHDECAQKEAALGNPEALIMLQEWGEPIPEEYLDETES